MKVQLKRMVTIGTAALVIVTGSGVFIGNSYANDDDEGDIGQLKQCDQVGGFAGLTIDCGDPNIPAVLIIYKNGKQRPCSCNAVLAACDETLPAGQKGSCLSGKISQLTRDAQAYDGSCTVCTTSGGKKKCTTNNTINC